MVSVTIRLRKLSFSFLSKLNTIVFNMFGIIGDYLTNGRLLTPEEGCGYAKVSTPRIVGGSEAKLGNLFMKYIIRMAE